jgi:hypothetical protein
MSSEYLLTQNLQQQMLAFVAAAGTGEAHFPPHFPE